MILQALTHCYEDLLKREDLVKQGKIGRPGWSQVKVAYGLDLDAEGNLVQLFHLQKEITRGKKKALAPRELLLPAQVKRSVAVAANFLCDNSGYLLGADSKGKPERTAGCFAAAKALHTELLQDAASPAAQAIVRFFARWDPAQASACPLLQEDWDDLMKGGNLTFYYGGHPAAEDPAVRDAWQNHYDAGSSDGAEDILCLVTGRHAPLARLHPNIKRVAGAQPTGAALVSFNGPAFCSYEHEQGSNAPTSEYAAFAYTTALNTLLADRNHVCRVGDTTIVFWADGSDSAYQDCAMFALFGGGAEESAAYQEADLFNVLKQLSSGTPVDWDGQPGRQPPRSRHPVLHFRACPQRRPPVGALFLAEQLRRSGEEPLPPLRAAEHHPPRVRPEHTADHLAHGP